MEREPLTRERILGAALELVDEQGLEKLSMRRLGERLGVEAMSLYRYVSGKQGLLNGLHGAILGEVRVPPGGGPWRARLRAFALEFRRVLAAHPKALPLFATRPAVTRESLQGLEAALALLAEAGLPPTLRLSALHSLLGFVVGLSLFHFGFEVEAYVDLPAPAEDFPLTTEAIRAMSDDMEEEFRFGLDALLDGLEARAASPGRRHRGRGERS